MLRILFRPHSIIVTILIFFFIWGLNYIRLNLHFLDPFNYGIKDYEITDIVFSRFRDEEVLFEDRIVLVDIGNPDRGQLAGIIDRVTAAGARVIGVDVMLEGRKDPVVDSLLRASICRAGNVVLATRLDDYHEQENIFLTEAACDTFFSNCATMGYANFVSNDTYTVRFFSPKERTRLGEARAFTTEIAKKYDPSSVQQLERRNLRVERINYVGDTTSFASWEAETILDTTVDLSGVLRDKIVLVGYLGGSNSNNGRLFDRFFSPLNPKYSGRSLPDMYGIVIHANVLRMILEGDYIYETPKWLSRLLSLLYCYLNVIFIHWVYTNFNEVFHGITRILQLIEFVAIFFLMAWLFHFFRVKFDFGLGILAMVLAYDFVMIYESLIRKNLPILEKLDGK